MNRVCRSLFIWAYEDIYADPVRKFPWYVMFTLQVANLIGYPRQAFCRLCNPIFFHRIGCSSDYQPLREVGLIFLFLLLPVVNLFVVVILFIDFIQDGWNGKSKYFKWITS